MYIVDIYCGPPQDIGYATSFWISEKASDHLAKFSKKSETTITRFLGKIDYWAKSGFEKWEGPPKSGKPIVLEWDGVYRLGYTAVSLHRIVGFYEKDNRSTFIAIDAFLKKGEQLSKRERAIIDEVARVKKEADWKRRQ